jgi:ribonuclease BN (tRNA processing enzyme)
MFQVQFIGVGNATTVPDLGKSLAKCDWQSNILVHSEGGKKLLLDCGGDVRFALHQQGYKLADVDALYVSHAHADHVGGIEGLAFSTFFGPNARKRQLFCSATFAGSLWAQSLRGGLDSIEGREMVLSEYFDVRKVRKNGAFIWEGITFELIQVVHIMAERSLKASYGLMIREGNGPKVFWTSDTQFCPNQISKFYETADIILHDCETGFKSGVHSHYTELVTLPSTTKEKMHLYHYHPNAPQKFDAKGDGFGGFVLKGEVLLVDDELSWHRKHIK